MKKTIIAASLTALAMGSVFAADTYKYNQAEGKTIEYSKDSATEGGKLGTTTMLRMSTPVQISTIVQIRLILLSREGHLMN